MEGDWEPPASDRFGRWPLIGGMLLIAAVTGLLLRPDLDGDADSELVIEEETPTPTPTPSPSAEDTPPSAPAPSRTETPAMLPVEDLAEARGEWARLADAPIDLPGSHGGVWTGTEFVVGFQPSVAAYDPAAGTWRELPAVPDPPRFRAQVVWTGQHIVVFGGNERTARGPPGVTACCWPSVAVVRGYPACGNSTVVGPDSGVDGSQAHAESARRSR